MIGIGILKLATQDWSYDRWRTKFQFSGQMADRATLQKQSFSTPRFLAQLFRAGRSGGRLILSPQICGPARRKGREPNDSDDDPSYFQDECTLVLQSSFGFRAKFGRTFCTALLLRCQEIRYAILFGIWHPFASQREMMSHPIAGKIIRLSATCVEDVAVYFLEAFWRKICCESANRPAEWYE